MDLELTGICERFVPGKKCVLNQFIDYWTHSWLDIESEKGHQYIRAGVVTLSHLLPLMLLYCCWIADVVNKFSVIYVWIVVGILSL